MLVRETGAMIRSMSPQRQPGIWYFVTVSKAQARRLSAAALAVVQEPEGPSLLLSEEVAQAEGVCTNLPMAHILLQVNSALDGVGLTAAVATTLEEAGIPANIIAGAQHDHVLVPVGMADRAVRLLQARAGA